MNIQEYHAEERASARGEAMRESVQWFAGEMERQLAANDHKPGWHGDNWTSLFARLGEEKDELLTALGQYQKVLMLMDGAAVEWAKGVVMRPEEVKLETLRAMLAKMRSDVVKEAADVANFALMIADNIGRALDTEATAVEAHPVNIEQEPPPLWQHKPPTCRRCGAKMRYPRPPAGDGWTWGAFGWQHDCSFHR